MSRGVKAPGAGKSFVDEVESGDRVRTLRALRRHLAERIEDGVPARDLAALARRLMVIVDELEVLDDEDGARESTEDELARRRARVLAAAEPR